VWQVSYSVIIVVMSVSVVDDGDVMRRSRWSMLTLPHHHSARSQHPPTCRTARSCLMAAWASTGQVRDCMLMLQLHVWCDAVLSTLHVVLIMFDDDVFETSLSMLISTPTQYLVVSNFYGNVSMFALGPVPTARMARFPTEQVCEA